MNTLIISILAQKGGVAKSFLAKLIGVELARLNFKVLIADMDISQQTTMRWWKRRIDSNIKPHVDVKSYKKVKDIEADMKDYNFVIFDGLPSTGDKTTSAKTMEIGEMSNLIIIPGSSSVEDMEPQIDLAHELVKNGVEKERILFCMTRASESKATNRDAMEYLENTGYKVIPCSIPFKTSYQAIALEGKAGSETRYPNLNKNCEEVVQYIANYMDL